MRKAPAAVFPLAMLAGAAVGQATHVVGPGGFATITAALAVAAQGDVILVQPGNYGATQVNAGVTIRGTAPGVSVVSIVATVPAGQTLQLSELAAWISITGGRASLDHCTFDPGIVAQSTVLHIHACVAEPSFFVSLTPALRATDSTVTAIDCSFRGGPAYAEAGWSAQPAIGLENSTFLGSRITCTGGAGYGPGPGGLSAQPAVRAINSSTWISDSNLNGGALISSASGPIVCPVDIGQGRFARCTFSQNCPVAIPTTGPLLGVHQPTVLQSPGPFTLEFNTEPNGVVAVYFATGLGNLTIAGLEQPILLDLTSTFHLETMFADATGFASGAWNVPPGLTNWTFFFQAVGTAPPPYPLQLSPVAGGVVR